jgi:hypothetical protein
MVMNYLDHSQNPAARQRACYLGVTLSQAILLAGIAPVRAENPPMFAFTFDFSSVPAPFRADFVAVGRDGNMYVLDGNNRRIVRCAANGTFINEVVSPGQFTVPGGIAADGSNNVYVTDFTYSRVVKFSSNGTFLTQWGSFGSGNGQFMYPAGIAVDSNENIYVADAQSHRIQKFTSAGAYLLQWGSFGGGNGQFNKPAGIAADSSNNVYVLDQGNDGNGRIQKFTSAGTYLTQWGTGAFAGSWSCGYGLAVDGSNNVYAAGIGIQKYTSDGSFLAQWTFPCAFSIALDPTWNFVYATDGSLEVFAYNPAAPIIYRQPQPTNQVIPAGVTVTVTAGVFSAIPASYQWTLNSTDVPAQTNADLTISNVTLSASGAYGFVVTNSLGGALSSNAVLTVLPALATTLPASGISVDGAVLNGSVTLGPIQTLAWFEWGADTHYGQIAGITNIAGGSGTVTFNTALSGLNVDLTYHYRLVAWNSFGIEYGVDQVFQVGTAPTARDLPPAGNTTNSAILKCVVSPGGLATTVHFQWGTYGSGYPNVTPAIVLPPGTNSISVTALITNLARAAAYQSQVVATNRAGTKIGQGVGFLTAPYSTAPYQIWTGVASSADGINLVASGDGGLWRSTDGGVTWLNGSPPTPTGNWKAVASSADGTRLVAANGNNRIYTSTNSGADWLFNSLPIAKWVSVASSADGIKLVAGAAGKVYTSTNGGGTWISNSLPVATWVSVASSADGIKLTAAASGKIYTSTNSGANWISNSLPDAAWASVASSADGTILAAAASGKVYISTNGGVTWISNSLPNFTWRCVASSADGTQLGATAGSSGVFISRNGGNTWISNNVAANASWGPVVLSADGAKWVAAGTSYPQGGIYISQSTSSPLLSLTPSGGNGLLSWVIPSMSFGLEQSDLTSTNWTDLTNQPPVLNLTNLQDEVTVPFTNEKSFYRLKH